MGMYDTIYFNCPNCGEELCCQSKSGKCELNTYPNTAVPISVAYDANRHTPVTCKCGKSYIFDTSILNDITLINLPIKEVR